MLSCNVSAFVVVAAAAVVVIVVVVVVVCAGANGCSADVVVAVS